MADRGRDLKISILSDLSRLDLEPAARDLESVGDAADRAGTQLDGLERTDADRALSDIEAGARDAQDQVDRLARTSADTARDVDRAFDKIAASSKANLGHSGKLDDATDDAKHAMGEVGEEALDTGREMAASFSGGVDDILGAGQELLANAGAAFGPAGIAIGIALASGFGLFQAKQAELQAQTQEFTDRLIEGMGKLTEAGIQEKLQEMASDGSIVAIGEQAERAGVSADYYARALAGDVEASKRVREAINKHREALDEAVPVGQKMTRTQSQQYEALRAVEDKLGGVAGGLDAAKSAYGRLESATAAGITSSVVIDAPTQGELNSVLRDIKRGLGTVVIPVKVGQSKFTNNANNSRYRD